MKTQAKLLSILLLINIFLQVIPMQRYDQDFNQNINSRQQKFSWFLLMPNEIKLKIFKEAIKLIIDSNNCLELPTQGIASFLRSIFMVNKELSEFSQEFQNYFIKFIKKHKERRIVELRFRRMLYFDEMKEHEAEAIALITSGLNSNLIVEDIPILSRISQQRSEAVNVFNSLIEHGADINLRSFSNMTPLMYASSEGKTKLVEILLKYGANINAQDDRQETALIKAASYSNKCVVELLLNHANIDVNIKNSNGETALMKLMSENKIGNFRHEYGNKADIAKIILKHSSLDINTVDSSSMTVLMHACDKGLIDIVEILLDMDADINVQDKDKRTALIYACHNGYASIIQMLLNRRNINVNIKDRYQQTALMYVCNKNYSADIVKMFLAIPDIDINLYDKYKKTALTYAYYNGRFDIVKMLLNEGANFYFVYNNKQIELNIKAIDDSGMTILMHACDKGLIDIVKILLDMSVEINVQDEHKRTALMYACDKGCKKVVKMLLSKYDIDVNLCDQDKRTALMYACNRYYSDIVKMLLDNEVDINAKDNDGRTALIIAVLNNFKEIVMLLLKHKDIDVNARDNYGETAFTYSDSENNIDIVKMLINHEKININIKDNNGKISSNAVDEKKLKHIVKLIDKKLDRFYTPSKLKFVLLLTAVVIIYKIKNKMLKKKIKKDNPKNVQDSDKSELKHNERSPGHEWA